MVLTELLLYYLARLFARTDVALTSGMKSAFASKQSCEQYRSSEIDKIRTALRRFDISLQGATVLDLGCNDGSLTSGYEAGGARSVIGVDVDSTALERAEARPHLPSTEYRLSTTSGLPVESEMIDVIVCYDVFEHVSQPAEILSECRRVLKPGGRMLIGTWGWYHPFAPHLWAAMPVPWAHVLVSERTLLRACRRVYHSSWYVPIYHDFDSNGQRYADRYGNDSISPDYVNKYLVRDFERVFRASGLESQVSLEPFSSGYASWTKPFLRIPVLREFLHGYLWAVLQKPRSTSSTAVALEGSEDSGW